MKLHNWTLVFIVLALAATVALPRGQAAATGRVGIVANGTGLALRDRLVKPAFLHDLRHIGVAPETELLLAAGDVQQVGGPIDVLGCELVLDGNEDAVDASGGSEPVPGDEEGQEEHDAEKSPRDIRVEVRSRAGTALRPICSPCALHL